MGHFPAKPWLPMAPDRWRMARPWHLSPGGVHRPTWRSRRCGRSLSSCGTLQVGAESHYKQRLVGETKNLRWGEKVCINGYGHPQVWSWYTLISDVYWIMEQSWQKVCLWSFNSVISQQTNWDDWADSLDTSGPRISRKEINQIPGWPWYWMITAAAIISGRVFMAEITKRHVIRVSWHVDFCRTRNIVPDSLKLSTPEIPEDLGQFRRDPHSNYKKQKQLESKWHVTHVTWIKWDNLADFLQNRMICLFTCNITMMFDARGFSELGQTQSFSALDAFLVPAIRGPTCPWHVHLWNLETPLGARSMLRWMMP